MSAFHITPPHINSAISNYTIMRDVLIAMIPASIAAVLLFGLKAFYIIVTCVASAVLAEALFNLMVKKKQTIRDFSAAVTGLLLALNLNTNVELWQCVFGSVFAIVVVKGFFGGFGKNIVNPAIAARVFMLLSFASVAGGAVITPLVDLSFLGNAVSGLEVANQTPTIIQLLVGAYEGTIGETCAIALLIGFVYLVARKVIKWYVPVAFAGTVFVCYFVMTLDVELALSQILAGGLLLGAIFMATDYVTTPQGNFGRVVFCVGAGVITFVIRQFGQYSEGVSIAILTMNLLTPFIAQWTNEKTLIGIK